MSVISRDGDVVESLRPLLDYFDIENRPMTAIGWTRSRSALASARSTRASASTSRAACCWR